MTTNARWISVLALVAFAAAACDDGDPVGVGDDTVHTEEAVELANAMVTASNAMAWDAMTTTQGDAYAGPASSAPQAAQTFSLDWDRVAPCQDGGEVAIDGEIDGSYDDETEELIASVGAVLAHDGCAFPTEHGVYTATGDPNLEFAADFHYIGERPEGEQTVSLTGSFTWEDEDGRSGACSVDLSGSLDPGDDATTRTLTGTFCGHSIEASLEIET